MDYTYLIEYGLGLVFELMKILLGLAGAWLAYKMAENQKVNAIATATREVVDLAIQTTGELEQTAVRHLRAASMDGSLSDEDVENLRNQLVILTKAKMSDPVKNLLEAAKADLVALILGASEDWLNTLKKV